MKWDFKGKLILLLIILITSYTEVGMVFMIVKVFTKKPLHGFLLGCPQLSVMGRTLLTVRCGRPSSEWFKTMRIFFSACLTRGDGERTLQDCLQHLHIKTSAGSPIFAVSPFSMSLVSPL